MLDDKQLAIDLGKRLIVALAENKLLQEILETHVVHWKREFQGAKLAPNVREGLQEQIQELTGEVSQADETKQLSTIIHKCVVSSPSTCAPIE